MPKVYGSPVGAQAPSPAAAQGRPVAGPATGQALRQAYNAHMADAMRTAHKTFIQKQSKSQAPTVRGPGSTLRGMMPTGLRGRQVNAAVDKASK